MLAGGDGNGRDGVSRARHQVLLRRLGDPSAKIYATLIIQNRHSYFLYGYQPATKAHCGASQYGETCQNIKSGSVFELYCKAAI
jgi:hypothetical protein